MAQNYYDEAIEQFERARSHYEALGQKIDIAFTLERLARLHSLRGEEPQTHLHADHALSLFREVDYAPGVVRVLVLYADRALMRRDVARAVKLLAGLYGPANDRSAEPELGKRVRELVSTARSKVKKRDYDTSWRIGETLSLDDLVQLALESEWTSELEFVQYSE